MYKRKDLTGIRFGRLIAIKPVYTKHRTIYWECVCDCGNTTIVISTSLRNKRTQSCGCLQKERTSESHLKPKGLTYSDFRDLIIRIYENMVKSYV